uniref:CD276 antigen homolog n=1 Tax=Erpetoichthys calabaricus TaxID=27687 RepID=A0A8C4XDV2_ERPCA
MAHIWRTLSFFVFLLPAVHVQDNKYLTAIIGETVQILCSLNTTESLKTENISVEWATSEGLIIHSFVKGVDNLSNQAPQFEGRTQLFRHELSRGNFSLRLSNVSVADEGEFVCSYYDGVPTNGSRVLHHQYLHVESDNCLTAIIGETVQIPCTLNTEESLKTENISVEWATSEGLIIHSFVKGVDNLSNQAPQFEGRPQLFRHELSRGNFSLRLSNVSVTDVGKFVCSYYDEVSTTGSRVLSMQCLQVADHYSDPVCEPTSPAKFTCTSTGGFPKPKVHWSVNKELLKDSSQVDTTLSTDSRGRYSVTSILTMNVTGKISVSFTIENKSLRETRTSPETEHLVTIKKPSYNYTGLVIGLSVLGIVLFIALTVKARVTIWRRMMMMKKKKNVTQFVQKEDNDHQVPLKQGPNAEQWESETLVVNAKEEG